MPVDLGFDGGLVAAFGVSDVKKSIDWYREYLGFELSFYVEEIGWAEVQSPIARVSLGFSQTERVEVKGGPTLTFGVKNIESARAQLEKKGVRFDGEIVEYPGMVKLTTFFDRDGHKLMLYQSLAQPQ